MILEYSLLPILSLSSFTFKTNSKLVNTLQVEPGSRGVWQSCIYETLTEVSTKVGLEDERTRKRVDTYN